MTIRAPGDKGNFAQYYLKNVAVSEGCGCAEGVLRKTGSVRAGDSLWEILAAFRKRFGKS